MICVSVLEATLEALLAGLRGLRFAEVRLERIRPDADAVKRIFSSGARLVATVRPGTMGDRERADILIAAARSGAAYVDVDLEMPGPLKEEVIRAARRSGCQVIVSYHNYDETPGREALEALVERCFGDGADIAKVACKARDRADAARLLALNGGGRPVIALGMGEAGRVTRVAGPLLGAPFTFASRGAGLETADGQIDAARLEKIFALIRS